MDQRSAYYLQVLEKIGAPLVIAALQGANGARAGEMTDEAQTVAALLSRAVQTGIDLGKTMHFAALPEQSDAVRLSLAALAARIMGGQYRAGGKIPAEADIKKIVAAFQAVLAFSENFSPGGEATQKLAETDGDRGVAMLAAFVPVINAVGAFSFGQPEQTLATDITRRLQADAARMSAAINNPDAGAAILRTLAQLYAASHEAVTAKLAQGGADATFEEVWRLYETRALMLESLAVSIIGEGQKQASARAPQPSAREASAAKEPAAAPLPKAAEKPVSAAAPPAAKAPPSAPAAQEKPAGNPMAMFAKKPAAPGVPEAPKTPQADDISSETGQEGPSEGGSNPKNPMAFFKKPDGQNEES